MFVPIHGRRNWLAYFFWRWILHLSGSWSITLDRYFFGPSHGMNDYDSLALQYKRSNVKADKLYSILPTVLSMVGNCKGKTITDVGCGGGFFTLELARRGARHVYGLDNSREQLTLALEHSSHLSITYVLRDVFSEKFKPTDIIVAPFVSNYARSKSVLSFFLRQLFEGMNEGGKLVLVIDLPNGRELRRFGAVKSFRGKPRDEIPIDIQLFREETPICKLEAVYYTPTTINTLLHSVGFRNITWHTPVVSDEGLQAMGADFWKGYTGDPELGYVTAEK